MSATEPVEEVHRLVAVLCPECRHCGQRALKAVWSDGLASYRAGALAQDAFPDLDDDERELIISGTHKECWDAMFAEED